MKLRETCTVYDICTLILLLSRIIGLIPPDSSETLFLCMLPVVAQITSFMSRGFKSAS